MFSTTLLSSSSDFLWWASWSVWQFFLFLQVLLHILLLLFSRRAILLISKNTFYFWLSINMNGNCKWQFLVQIYQKTSVKIMGFIQVICTNMCLFGLIFTCTFLALFFHGSYLSVHSNQSTMKLTKAPSKFSTGSNLV